MMTSVVSNPARGTRDRTLPSTTQTTQPQKQIQATAEQLRLAQVIYDNNDADFEDKVKQLIEVTGKTQDECMVALHDCNEDVNRAINFLLESHSDTNSWETVGKKRNLGKEGGTSEIKESRERKGGEREASRGRGGSNRRGRGISRGREGRFEENGFEVAPGERGGDRGRRGRGRGPGVRGRGRAAVGNRFSSQGMGTFNPADYTANSGARQETWEGDGNEPAEAPGTWVGNVEDWTSEDWNEDLSETKVFTASSAPGNNVDMSGLLPKAGVAVGCSMDSDLGAIVDGPSAEDLGQSLVFTNSHHNGRTATHSYAHATANSYAHAASASTTYAHAALSSVLGSGFGSLNGPKPTSPLDSRTSEQLNGPRLGQRASQTLANTTSSSSSNVSKDAGPLPMQSPAPASFPSLDIKAQRVENSPVTAQNLELKLQPEPSAVLSQLAQRQQQSTILSTTESLGLSQSHVPQVPTPPGHESSVQPLRDGASPGLKLQGMDPPNTEAPQRQLKTQRRRVPPPSKIPSSAVEMPGSADMSGLNFQFGALDFGSEAGSGTVDMAHMELPREQAPTQAPAPAAAAPMSVPTTVPTQHPQSSLFPKPGSVGEHMSSLPSISSGVSDPSFPSPSLGLPSATPSPSLGLPCAATPPSCAAPTTTSRSESSGQRSLPPHLGFSQSKDVTSAGAGPLTNGYSGMKTQSIQDNTSSSSRTVKTESPVMTSDSGPGHHIPSPAVTPSHSTPIPSLSSHVTSNHPPGAALATSSSLTHQISHEESSSSSGNLHAFSSSSSSQVVNPNPSVPLAVSSSIMNGLHPSGAPGLTQNGTNTSLSVSGSRTAPLLTATSGKAPPNLAQGVPPLLANQYIMGPGGLLPAYPQIYGYEDLQMLQSRLPMDYYGVTFPGTTAAMAARDGLANNPYSGEATKFGRNDSSSPAPPTSLSTAGVQSQPQQALQAGTQGQGAVQSQGQQTQNQAFLNPPLPPGYGYTGLPYYAGMPGVPSAFQYGPTVFVPPASAKQPAMGMANPSNQYHQQHQPSYGQHAYSTAFDDLSQAHAGEYSKGGYGGSAQSQAKSAGGGPGKDDSTVKSVLERAPGLSGSGTSGGVPDMGGSIYSKTQSFDKQGFHTGTPPPFSLPSALGGTGPLNPGGAPGYAPAPFLHILPPHQQPHSQLLHHHLTQEGQGGPGQRGQSSSMQQKTQGSKSSYGSSPYWAN
ncbi:ubiquitin-associated protein 2 isoform X1 [Scophthalmus maximus]|uniref:ubiquitin-associated protein 2 isoform X1 n=1 Tax=Scophthalmus maximus TaxID=52904 RepID=UPI001FA92334|nr:ubiquitin-associated protein 2 isoform X1 [Scophthalmus maximus]